MIVNGEEIFYLVIDLIGGKKIDGFNIFFLGSGDMNCGYGIDIDREDWEGGYGLICLDMILVGSGYLDYLIFYCSGNVNLYFKFGNFILIVFNLIVYVEF